MTFHSPWKLAKGQIGLTRTNQMKKKIKIAVTGGIGSGKSTVCNILKQLGYPVCSCDEIYAKVKTEPKYLEQLKGLFPDCVPNGTLQAQLLSDVVFHDKEKLAALNALSHPIIMRRVHEFLEEQQSTLVFAEVPLLFEGGFEKDFDNVWIVTRNVNERIASVQQRDGISASAVCARIKNQINHDEFLNKIGVTQIQNDGNLAQLKRVVEQTIFDLKKCKS